MDGTKVAKGLMVVRNLHLSGEELLNVAANLIMDMLETADTDFLNSDELNTVEDMADWFDSHFAWE